jgi:hypothetical protein
MDIAFMQEGDALDDGIDDIIVTTMREGCELGTDFTPYETANTELDIHRIE